MKALSNRVRRAGAALSTGLIAALYIFGHPFAAIGASSSDSLTSVIALERPDDSPATTAKGTVTVKRTSTSQQFTVDVRNIPAAESTPVGGLGVFLSSLPLDTNSFYFVNVLNGSTNGHWRLNLNAATAPAQLDVSDVTNLVDRIVLIADTATNVYLETIIPPFVSSPAKMSYKQRVTLTRPSDSPSPNATGQLIVKLDGVHGTSLFDVRAKKLDVGNSYCSWVLAFVGQATPPCSSSNIVTSTAHFMNDTSKGQQLLDSGLSNGWVRVDQLSGMIVEVRDNFGATHLQGVIP